MAHDVSQPGRDQTAWCDPVPWGSEEGPSPAVGVGATPGPRDPGGAGGRRGAGGGVASRGRTRPLAGGLTTGKPLFATGGDAATEDVDVDVETSGRAPPSTQSRLGPAARLPSRLGPGGSGARLEPGRQHQLLLCGWHLHHLPTRPPERGPVLRSGKSRARWRKPDCVCVRRRRVRHDHRRFHDAALRDGRQISVSGRHRYFFRLRRRGVG
jgi:hypothetical protein